MYRPHRSSRLLVAFGLLAAPLILGQTCMTAAVSQGGGSAHVGDGGFHETWAPAVTGSSYLPDMDPPARIRGSEGNWYLSATVTVADNTPHYAEVIGKGDAKRVKVVSNRSNTAKADNIWLSWHRRLSGQSRTIPITPDTRISFVESGELLGPQSSAHSWGRDDNCGIGTCGIYFGISDTNNNALLYRLQTPSDAVERTDARRVEMIIESEDGRYSRNLYEDFARIPNFDPTNATIQEMVLEVYPWDESTEELGWATIDDIKITHGAE